MNRKKKIIGITLLVIGLLVGGYFLARYLMIRSFMKNMQPKEPTYEVPITYNVGWQSKYWLLSVDDFSVEIEDSRLNLFNRKSLINYTIKGELKAKKGKRKPYIKKVHVSERIDTSSVSNVIIEVTPIIGFEKVDEQEEGIVPFEITNGHLINSRDWGENKFKFVCGDFVEIVEVVQSK